MSEPRLGGGGRKGETHFRPGVERAKGNTPGLGGNERLGRGRKGETHLGQGVERAKGSFLR